MTAPAIPFSRLWLTGHEQRYLNEVLASGHTSAGGAFTRRCESWLEQHSGSARALLTASCTNALELSAVLAGIAPGDEVIMPSFTFTSTANAFVLRGAVPVFVDIRPDTLNIDETLIEAAITERTRAIVPVHYAGVACEMDTILDIARRHGLLVIEDAAQGVGASYKGRALGSLGHLGCYSFHMTKNISCGEGGALLINDPALIERAEILHDKGTTRAQFRAGKIRQYSWVDLGMSAPPSELQAACLLAQLEACDSITQARLEIWRHYQARLDQLFQSLAVPFVPEGCQHNGHIYALRFATIEDRERAAAALLESGIGSAIHYEPLHRSAAGRRYGRCATAMPVSDNLPYRLLRLPIYPGLATDVPARVASALVGLCSKDCQPS